MTAPIRIVEDDGPVAASLVALLESWGFAAEVFRSGEAFLEAPPAPETPCVLLDLRLPGRGGLDVLAALRARGDGVPVIVATGHGDVDLAVRALRSGAQDFVEKPFDDEDLVARIRAVIAARAERARHAARLARLTPREQEVMREVVAGRSNKEVARRLGLSPKTVELHRARVMEKTGAASLSHLVRLAFKAGIDPGDEAP